MGVKNRNYRTQFRPKMLSNTRAEMTFFVSCNVNSKLRETLVIIKSS
jgi:hypothetical protein